MRARNSRSGFTLVELLVVIGILAALMGMLLPAVQSARESGRRNNCMNNQTQLGKAVLNFDSQRGYVPGWRNTLRTTSSGSSIVGWPVLLLPNVDRRDIYRLWESGATPRSYIDLFICPSSSPDLLGTGTNDFLSFGGNCGSGANTNFGDGVMFDATLAGGRVSLDYVSSGDGSATTMLFSERRSPESRNWGVTPGPATSGTTMGFVFSGSSSATVPVMNVTTSALTPNSAHPGGVVMAFCDGHTIFLSAQINSNVYNQLLTSNSAESSMGALPALDESSLKWR